MYQGNCHKEKIMKHISFIALSLCIAGTTGIFAHPLKLKNATGKKLQVIAVLAVCNPPLNYILEPSEEKTGDTKGCFIKNIEVRNVNGPQGISYTPSATGFDSAHPNYAFTITFDKDVAQNTPSTDARTKQWAGYSVQEGIH
jgi:hypothetical protein